MYFRKCTSIFIYQELIAQDKQITSCAAKHNWWLIIYQETKLTISQTYYIYIVYGRVWRDNDDILES